MVARISHMMRNNMKATVFIAYLLLTILCFFPLVNGSASLNWDASDLWLPWKHFISEELYNGQLPLWNPYHGNGFPQHGDSMTWYPLSWIFAFLNGQYNLSALNQEYLFHIFVAGLAFYHFSGNFVHSRKVRFLLGLSYMFSGFMIGNAQHVSWIISAAWMPFVFHYLIGVLRQQNRPAIFKLALTGFLFFSGGYLAIFFVALYIMLIGTAVYFYRNRQQFRKTLLYLGFSVALIALLALPLLISAWNIFPLFNRFDPTDPHFNLNTGSTPLNGLLAIVLPLASGIYNMTEIGFGSFSAYLGLVPILLLCFFYKQLFRESRIGFVVLLAVFFLLCSMGDLLPLRGLLAKLPLLDLFRYPTLFRLFFIFFLLLGAGMTADRRMNEKSPFTRRQFLLVSLILAKICLLVILGCLSKLDFEELSHYFKNLFAFKPLEKLQLFNRVFINISLLFLAILLINLLARFSSLKRLIFLAWGIEILFVGITGAAHTVYHPVDVVFSNDLMVYQPQNYAQVHRKHNDLEKQSWEGYLDFSWQGKTFYLKQWSKLWYNPLKLNYSAGMPYSIPDNQADSTSLFSLVTFRNRQLFPMRNAAVNAEIKNNHDIRLHLNEVTDRDGNSFVLVKQRLVPEWSARVDGRSVKISQSSQGFILIPVKKNSKNILLNYDVSVYRMAFWIFALTLLFVFLALFWFSENKSLIALGSGALLLVIAWSSWGRLSEGEKLSDLTDKKIIRAKDLDNHVQFRSLAYWRKSPEEMSLIQNYPKTDSDISYFRYFYPKKTGYVQYRKRRYARFSKDRVDRKLIYSLRDTTIGSGYKLELLALEKTTRRFRNKVICLKIIYKAENKSPQNLWLAHFRKEQWVNGMTIPFGNSDTLRDDEQKIIIRYFDLNKYPLLPGDALRLYTWCDDPQASIRIESLELSVD